MGLFNSKKPTSNPGPPPPIRQDQVFKALKLGMEWHDGDPDGDDFDADRDRYYRALNQCTQAEVDHVEAALKRHGYQL